MSSRVASWKLRQKRFNAIVGHQSVIMYWMLTMLNTRVLDAPIQHGFNMLCQHRLDSIQWYSTESIQHRLNIKSLQKVSFKCETTTSGHREKYQHQQPTPATTYTNNLHQQSTPTPTTQLAMTVTTEEEQDTTKQEEHEYVPTGKNGCTV